MFKKLLFTGIGVALLASPLMASAASIADLQAEVASLIAQIRALETGSSTVGVGAWVNASSTVATSPANSQPMPCYAFTRSLSRGKHGDDVKSLQQFLYDQGFFDGLMSGYFGTQTEAALQNWQAHEGIAMRGHLGFGIFGPVSRSHFKNWCQNPGQNNQQTFSADPQSGPAPLTTTFTTNDSLNASSTYSVDFGDGSSAQMTKGSCIAITAVVGGQGGIRCSYTAQHTYANNGTYTAKLLKQKEWSCPSGMMCAMMMPAPQVVGTLTITVGSTTSTSFSAAPTSGQAPLPVTFTESGQPSGTYVVDFGDGSSTTMTVPSIQCITTPCVPGPQKVSHTYTQSGTFTATLYSVNVGMGTCMIGHPNCNRTAIGSVVITVSGTSANDQRINAPATVTLTQGGIAEIRNKSAYFTLTSIGASNATIQVTPVGCWNSFPSDPTPQIRCMIAVVPIPPVTLSVGQTYTASAYTITLTNLTSTSATFSVGA